MGPTVFNPIDLASAESNTWSMVLMRVPIIRFIELRGFTRLFYASLINPPYCPLIFKSCLRP
jgi:hypothetical protein